MYTSVNGSRRTHTVGVVVVVVAEFVCWWLVKRREEWLVEKRRTRCLQSTCTCVHSTRIASSDDNKAALRHGVSERASTLFLDQREEASEFTSAFEAVLRAAFAIEIEKLDAKPSQNILCCYIYHSKLRFILMSNNNCDFVLDTCFCSMHEKNRVAFERSLEDLTRIIQVDELLCSIASKWKRTLNERKRTKQDQRENEAANVNVIFISDGQMVGECQRYG